MNLFEIYCDAVDAVSDANRVWMEAHGVARHTLWNGPAAFGAARIEISGRTFQFVDDGQPAVVVPVADSYDINYFEDGFADLLAFQPSDPTRWWSLRDTMPVLNLEAIQRAVPCMGIDEVLAVYETPVSWLQGSRDGIVILDWSCHLSFWLGGVARILCDTERLARRLADALWDPARTLPEIRFSEARHAA